MPSRDEKFEEFFRYYFTDVRRYVARRYGEADADDIAQETMLRAYCHFADLDGSAWPWLATVARRVGIDHWRRCRCVPTDDALLHEMIPPGPDDCAAAIARFDARCRVSRLLARLTAAERQVLVWHDLREVAIREIARATHLSENTVRQRLFRARRRLAREVRTRKDHVRLVTPLDLLARTARSLGGLPRRPGGFLTPAGAARQASLRGATVVSG